MKDYKKILEGVVNIINATEKSDIGFVNICTYIGENCPELKESEDEQHRKWILEYLYDGLRKSDEQFKDQFNAAIAWLEKQGEKAADHKPVLDIEIPFGARDSELVEESIAIPDGCYAVIEDDKVVIRKGENPAWSKEDEKGLNDALACVEIASKYAKDENDMGNCWYANKWLKSLRHSNWKPSIHQLEALDFMINSIKTKTIPSEGYVIVNAISLYEDLKELLL